jgi:hypothetical protein
VVVVLDFGDRFGAKDSFCCVSKRGPFFIFFESGLVKSMTLKDSEPISLKKGLPAVVRMHEQEYGGARAGNKSIASVLGL